MKKWFYLIIFSILFNFGISYGETFSISQDTTIIGKLQIHTVKNKESLIEIARHYDLGYNEIVDANSQIDPFVPGDGNKVIIPTFWILPDRPNNFQGIIINLSEMRLYYFHKKSKRSTSYNISNWNRR